MHKALVAALAVFTLIIAGGPAAAEPAAASSSASPEAFMRDLLRRLTTTDSSASWVTHRPARMVDPGFQRLQDDNGHLAQSSGFGEDLDSDPVCECQDYGGSYTMTSLTRRGSEFADARIRQGGEPVNDYTIVLRLAGGIWRIYDVIDSEGSTRAMLTRHNACMRASHNEAVITRCFAGHHGA